MRTFDFNGNGSDGSSLIPGQVYMARSTSGSVPKDPAPRPYKAVRNGSLFSMWPQDERSGYRLPQYMEFEDA